MLKPDDRVDFRVEDETWRLHNQVVARVVLDKGTNSVKIEGLTSSDHYTPFLVTRKEYIRLGDGDLTSWGFQQTRLIEKWIATYMYRYHLVLIDPKTHDCQWQNIKEAVFLELGRRAHLGLFARHRDLVPLDDPRATRKNGPGLLWFWHHAGFIPREHEKDITERSTRGTKATTFAMPRDAYIFTGPKPYVTAQMRVDRTPVRKRRTTSNG